MNPRGRNVPNVVKESCLSNKGAMANLSPVHAILTVNTRKTLKLLLQGNVRSVARGSCRKAVENAGIQSFMFVTKKALTPTAPLSAGTFLSRKNVRYAGPRWFRRNTADVNIRLAAIRTVSATSRKEKATQILQKASQIPGPATGKHPLPSQVQS